MKRLLTILISILLVLSLTACSANEARLYEDRFDELDIGGRINELAYSIERGRANALLYQQAETIIEDLRYIEPKNDRMLMEINNSFIRSAQLLILAMDHTKNDAPLACAGCYREAQQLYNLTNRKLNQYKKNMEKPAP